jgi:hypothetical protein
MSGRTDEARTESQHILDMGEAEDALLKAPFDSLHIPEVAVTANRKAIGQATLALELPDPGLLPEDIDYDSVTKRFFVTSVLEKKIVAFGVDGKARSDFALAPDVWPMAALKLDTQRRRLWATEAAFDGFTTVKQSDWRRSAVLCFDLNSGKLLSRIEGSGALADMVLTQDGTPVVADGEGGGVYRVTDSKTLERIDLGDFVSPQTPALTSDGRSLFVPDYLRGIGVMDLSSRRVRWFSMDNKFIFSGIDGLYAYGDTLLAVQNGSSPERVVWFRLDASHGRIVSQGVIESATSTIGDPTHGVIIGSDFYYIANSGWDTLNDNGERKPGTKITPGRIMRVDLHSLN